MKHVRFFAACAAFILFQFFVPAADVRFIAGAQEGEEVQETAEETKEVQEPLEEKEKGEKGEQNGEEGTAGQDGQSGQDGADGEVDASTPEEPLEEEQSEAQINTGDVSSTAEISNNGNANTVNSEEETTAEELPLCSELGEKEKSHGKAQKGTKEESGEEGEQYCREEIEMEVENENDITIENDAEVEADTGANTVNDNPGDAAIDTGDADAIADVFNLANTNIIESSGLFVLLSSLKERFLDIDVRQWAEYFEGDDPVCSKTACITFRELEALNRNNAAIVNDIVVRAQTGENEASGNAGDASIATGDAYAAANVVNIANTNIINSNYLLFIANNFGSFLGDIVFPSASSFFTSLFEGSTPSYDRTEIENRNTAKVSNNATTTSETGANEADGNKSSIVQTGGARSAANIYNQINTNLVGGNSFVALVRVSGDWTGEVYGLPDGISWRRTAGGIVLYSNDMALSLAEQAEEPEEDAAEEVGRETEEEKNVKGEKGSQDPSVLDLENRNSAAITNNVEVVALTGKNKLKGNSGEGTVQTGDAYAIANIVNIANTNVIGKNWLFAIFNILGNFEGSISFGRPDLWVGQRAEISHDPVLPGDLVTYYLTVANKGDALATGVTVKSVFPLAFLDFGASDSSAKVEGDTISWELEKLGPGESREFSFGAILRDDIPLGLSKFLNTSSATSKESEENGADNTDTVELLAFREEPAPPENGAPGRVHGPSGSAPQSTASAALTGSDSFDTKAPNLRVTKTHGVQESIQAGDSVDYTIVVTNTNGGAVQEAVLVDTLETETGELVHEEVWDLGRIFPDEEITITYTTVFAHQTGPGVYRNNARVEALGTASNVASTSIVVEESPYVVLSEELFVAEAKLRSLEAQLLELATEEQQFLAIEEDEAVSAEHFPQAPEIEREKPFLASLTGRAAEYGRWLSAFAAASLALLFFLLRRKVV